MRIIAGIAKGRTLQAPKGPKTRPMMDRAKEAIFSALAAKVEDAAVLDLYAGSGSLGLEALSRGARSVVFVEWRREAVRVLKANIAAVGLGGEVVSAKVEDFRDAAPGHGIGAFDLAFVDPPYEVPLPSVEAVLGRLVRWLADDAMVVVHRRSGSGEISEIAGLALSDRRRYGDAEITRLTKTAHKDSAHKGGEGMTTALVPGSFDPPTLGHIDVVKRCASIFDKVVVAVVRNPSKSPLFTSEERQQMLEEHCPWPNVEVDCFDGLLVDFAKVVNADVIVKGLRVMTDFDHELQLAQMNRHLSGIVTMFVATKPELGYLSSSLVKEVARFGGDVTKLVPGSVAEALAERVGS